jgi:hypothetical protein
MAGMYYNSTALTLGKLFDDTQTLESYNKQILELAQKEFYKKHIDFYGYERFVNIIQCMNLQIENLKQNLDWLIGANRTSTPEGRFDIKI